MTDADAWVAGANVSDETMANEVSCSGHNTYHAANTSFGDTHDVMSRDSMTAAGQSQHHCDDVIPGIGPLPLQFQQATDPGADVISGLSPSLLESVEYYRRLSFAVYAWRLLLARTALGVATDIEQSLPNHDLTAAAASTVIRDLSMPGNIDSRLRRFHPYLI